MPSCQGNSGDFFHGKRRGYSNRELWKKALTQTGISLSQKIISAQKIRHVFCGRYHILAWSFFERSEDNARLYGSLGRPGWPHLRSGRRRTKRAIKENLAEMPDRTGSSFSSACWMPNQQKRSMGFLTFFFGGVFVEPRLINGNIHASLAVPESEPPL